MIILLCALAFAAGWVACALRVYFGQKPESLDPFSAVLLEETRTILAEIYADAGLEPEKRTRLLQEHVRRTEAEFRKTPPWKGMLPIMKKNVRPLLVAQVLQVVEGLKVDRSQWDA